MTDFTFQSDLADRASVEDTRGGFFAPPHGGLLRDLYEDFRAVPVEAWIILAVATVMSNLFIALA
ncbi:hypothetical protein [Oleisolibacter albus]|uniref:hypothetical protein n=1 Tax=Oleisolibacter albus TaxID=2171757 RepID=UPI000DF221B1|nr:hypothetical protein [Oleisolibacter albus]